MDPNQPTSRPIFAEMFCAGLWKLGWVLSFINKCKLLKCLWRTDTQYVAPSLQHQYNAAKLKICFVKAFMKVFIHPADATWDDVQSRYCIVQRKYCL